MTTTNIFLARPAGVRIETYDNVPADFLDHARGTLTVTRVRDKAIIIIPVDNIASLEITV